MKVVSQSLKSLIAENKEEEVLQILFELGFKGAPKNELILYRKRLNTLKAEVSKGIIKYDEAKIESNKIADGLIRFIDAHHSFIDTGETSTYLLQAEAAQTALAPDNEERNFVNETEVDNWISHLENSRYNLKACQNALFAIDQWKKDREFKGFRAWKRIPAQSEQAAISSFRFWGLFNLRPSQDKWVWIAWDVQTNQLAFVKEMQPEAYNQDKLKRLQWERDIYLKLNEEEALAEAASGIVSIISHDQFWFATSFATYGNLHWHLFDANRISNISEGIQLQPDQKVQLKIFGRIGEDFFSDLSNWKMTKELFTQIAYTLSILHEHEYIHRDLHPANVLIKTFDQTTQSVEALVCDFDRTRTGLDAYPPRYLHLDGQELSAPERERPHDELTEEELNAYHGLPTCDVYPLAATLGMALLGRELNDHTRLKSALRKYKGELPFGLGKLLLQALDSDPRERPSARQFYNRLRLIPSVTMKTINKITNSLLVVFFFFIIGFGLIEWVDWDCVLRYNCLAAEINKDLSLDPNTTYMLNKTVFVDSASTLTIPPGTKILAKDQAMLVIKKGAKINARGTVDAPIIFTSWKQYRRPHFLERLIGRKIDTLPKPGDWGGVVILGQAPSIGVKNLEFCPYIQNHEDERCDFGKSSQTSRTAALNDNSGVFKFVHIEYAGKIIFKDKEVNGLTLGGVGSQTEVSHIFVRNPLDDCFEIFGGNVQAKYLICENAGDDAFDYDNGFFGSLQYLLMIGKPGAQALARASREEPDKIRPSHSALEGTAPFGIDPKFVPDISNITICLATLPEKYSNLSISPFDIDNDHQPKLSNILLRGFSNSPEDTTDLSPLEIVPLDMVLRNDYPRIPSNNIPILGYTSSSISRKDYHNYQFKPNRIIRPKNWNGPPTDTLNFIGAFRDTTDHWSDFAFRRNQ